MLRPGVRVQITKQGPLFGQEGRVNAIDRDQSTVVVALDDGMTVGVQPNEVQVLQQQPANTLPNQPPFPQDNQQMVQVKIPNGATMHINGFPVEAVLAIARMHPSTQQQLQQHFQEELPQVTLGGNTFDDGPPMPFGGGFPAGGFLMGMPVPGFPPQQAHPDRPDDKYIRLNFSRSLLDMFMHMRHHMIEAAGIPDEDEAMPGEEWKQRQMAENQHVFEFSDYEKRLYESCCGVLADFLDSGRENPQVDPS